MNWDGQYFLQIVTQGYTHENVMAFFPLFPLITRFFSDIIYYFVSCIVSYHSVVLITGWLINTWCFREAAVSLHDLIRHMRGGADSKFTDTVVFLFCYNPASIFFSAFYSESMFAWLTFTCVLSLYKRWGSVGTWVDLVPFIGLNHKFSFLNIFVLEKSSEQPVVLDWVLYADQMVCWISDLLRHSYWALCWLMIAERCITVRHGSV